MSKYYRVLEDNFLWDKGAIISDDNGSGGYRAIDPVFEAAGNDNDLEEYISSPIVEHKDNARFFERVYPLQLVKKDGKQ